MWKDKVKKLKRVTVRVRQLPCNCLVNLANGKLFIPCLDHQRDHKPSNVSLYYNRVIDREISYILDRLDRRISHYKSIRAKSKISSK